MILCALNRHCNKSVPWFDARERFRDFSIRIFATSQSLIFILCTIIDAFKSSFKGYSIALKKPSWKPFFQTLAIRVSGIKKHKLFLSNLFKYQELIPINNGLLSLPNSQTLYKTNKSATFSSETIFEHLNLDPEAD